MEKSDDPAIASTGEEGSALNQVSASRFLPANSERIFRALTSPEICEWWVRPGVFDTRGWSGDVWVGGHWAASGVGGGQPYRLEGEYLEIDAPRRLVHTWKAAGSPDRVGTVTYGIAPDDHGARLSINHIGLPSQQVAERTRAGWETSLECLAKILEDEMLLHEIR